MQTVVKALISDETGNILLLRRSTTHPHFPHHLDFPGGEVEHNEPHIDAVRREILEEIGVEIPADQLNLAYQRQTSEGLTHKVYTAQVSGAKPNVEISWEHDQFQWLPFGELASIPLPDGVDDYHLTVLDFIATT